MHEGRIRVLRRDELDTLVDGMPDRSRAVQEDRLARQERGESTILIAWIGDIPVGHLVVNWSGSASPEVRAHLDASSTPDLEDLLVLENRRGRGVGSLLLDEAERLARERGLEALGVDVATENDGARSLYERRGHRECGLGAYVIRASGRNADASPWAREERVEYLVKALGPSRT